MRWFLLMCLLVSGFSPLFSAVVHDQAQAEQPASFLDTDGSDDPAGDDVDFLSSFSGDILWPPLHRQPPFSRSEWGPRSSYHRPATPPPRGNS